MTRGHEVLARAIAIVGLDAEGFRVELQRHGCAVTLTSVEMLFAGSLVPGERMRRAIDRFIAAGAVEHRRGWPCWSIRPELWDRPHPENAA